MARSQSVDLSPAFITGALSASRVRVVWSAGVLYIAHSNQRVDAHPCPDMPVKSGSKWTASLESGTINITRRGCSCSAPLRSVPLGKIIALATS